MELQQEILSHLDGLRGVDTHSHHLPDRQFQQVNLKFLYDHSYCDWMDHYPADPGQAPAFLRKNGCNSYFRWLGAALTELYGVPAGPDTVRELDAAVRAAYRDPQHHLQILRENCRYDRILLDNYGRPGQVESDCDLFVPVLRCNMFAVCNTPDRRDHNGNNPAMYLEGVYDQDFDGYLRAVADLVSRHRILKFAIAYDFGNRIECFDRRLAEAAYCNADATEAEYRGFYEYMVWYLCRLAGETGAVVQFHTGLGNLTAASPMYLHRLIASLPGTQFDLFHGGYPWCDDLLALLHNYPNVFADLCWLPLISTSAAMRFLREALEVSDAHRILWGCDTWTSEESYGAVLAFRHVVSEVLAELYRDGGCGREDARYLAERIWRGNAVELFQLDG